MVWKLIVITLKDTMNLIQPLAQVKMLYLDWKTLLSKLTFISTHNLINK